MANEELCVCGTCLKGQIKELEKRINALEANMGLNPIAGGVKPHKKMEPMLLMVQGKSYRCHCGANIFVKLSETNYQCNACYTLYEGA